MKRKLVVIIFLYLCIHLVGGYGNAHASAHISRICYSPMGSNEKIQKVENQTANPGYLVIKNAGLSEEDSSIITVIDEDDEDSIHKHEFTPRFFLAFYYAFLSTYDCNGLADRLSSYKPLYYDVSCKYIEQRVLRI